MPCSLTKDGLQWDVATGSNVTIKVVATATKLVNAEYNSAATPVTNDDSTTFTVVSGIALLLLNLAGPQDTVAIVEDCGNGQTKRLGGYKDNVRAAMGFVIVGK